MALLRWGLVLLAPLFAYIVLAMLTTFASLIVGDDIGAMAFALLFVVQPAGVAAVAVMAGGAFAPRRRTVAAAYVFTGIVVAMSIVAARPAIDADLAALASVAAAVVGGGAGLWLVRRELEPSPLREERR